MSEGPAIRINYVFVYLLAPDVQCKGHKSNRKKPIFVHIWILFWLSSPHSCLSGRCCVYIFKMSLQRFPRELRVMVSVFFFIYSVVHFIIKVIPVNSSRILQFLFFIVFLF